MNYDSGDYECIDENGHCWDHNEFDDDDDLKRKSHISSKSEDLWPFCLNHDSFMMQSLWSK